MIYKMYWYISDIDVILPAFLTYLDFRDITCVFCIGTQKKKKFSLTSETRKEKGYEISRI